MVRITANVLVSGLKRATSQDFAYQKMPTHDRRPPSTLPSLLTRFKELQEHEEVNGLAHPGRGLVRPTHVW